MKGYPCNGSWLLTAKNKAGHFLPLPTLVACLLGMLLLFAAGMKLYARLAALDAPDEMFSAAWLQPVGIGFEFFLGLWLLSTRWQPAAWATASLAFAVFAGVNLYAGWNGQATCTCFGPLKASPRWAFAIDLAALALLATARPMPGAWKRPTREDLVGWANAALVGCGGVGLLLGLVLNERPPGGSSSQPTLLIPSPDRLDFGAIPPGGRREVMLWLHNPLEDAVEVAEVKTSCHCFHISLPSRVIQPGHKVPATAAVDFSHDKGFSGRQLLLVARGMTEDRGRLAFFVSASVEVAQAPEEGLPGRR